jgi:Ca2+-binding EF-hand superfamily protein
MSMLPAAACPFSLQVFNRFDGDGSGRISTAELLELVGKHGPGFTSELDEEVRLPL